MSKCHVLPVLENGKLVGVVTRDAVLAALRPIYGERVTLVEQGELETA